ncbi:helix-turn-helix domain-containing protein [Leptospira mtsangambouensis]|nr:helix-turn-helix domain-containing protein [Leptospira mtsangambouensis]
MKGSFALPLPRMKIFTYFPTAMLLPFVQKYLIIESKDGIENRILPNPNLVLSFQLRGNLRSFESNTVYDLPRTGIAGLRKTARKIIYPKNSSALLVILTGIGAAGFFGEPISEFYGKTIALNNFISNRLIENLEEQLFFAKSNEECILLVEDFLIRNKKNRTIDPSINTTLQKINLSKGQIKMNDIKQGLPISLDSLEKKFKESIGTTPKQYANLLRIHTLIRSYTNETNLTNLAQKAGYFDQSHFNKEFKLFTGESPKLFFKKPQIW